MVPGSLVTPFRDASGAIDFSAGDQQSEERNEVKDEDQDLVEQDADEVDGIELLGRDQEPPSAEPMHPSVWRQHQQAPKRQDSEIDDRAPEEHAPSNRDTHLYSPFLVLRLYASPVLNATNLPAKACLVWIAESPTARFAVWLATLSSASLVETRA